MGGGGGGGWRGMGVGWGDIISALGISWDIISALGAWEGDIISVLEMLSPLGDITSILEDVMICLRDIIRALGTFHNSNDVLLMHSLYPHNIPNAH